MATMLKANENVTVEQIEAEEARLAVLKASLELKNLESTGISDFRKAVNEAHTVEEIYKICSNFKGKVERVRRVLNPTPDGEEAKRGRPKKETASVPSASPVGNQKRK